MKRTIILLSLMIIVLSLGCTKDNIDNESHSTLPKISIVDISQESDWDYWVLADNADYYFIKVKDQKPESFFYHSSNGDQFLVLLENGRPVRIIAEHWIFIFDNFQDTYVDIGIISPDGETEVIRKIDTEIDWNNLELKSFSATEEWSDVIRWTGRVVGAVPCGLSIAATKASLGILWPTIVLKCGKYALGLSADVMVNEFEFQNDFMEYVKDYKRALTVLDCRTGDYWGCVSGILGEAAQYVEELEIRDNEIKEVTGIILNQNEIVTQGLVAYLPFNGNAADLSGNNNNGTVHGATLSSDRFGNSNSAYSFDGVNDYIDIEHSQSLNITNNISISFWAKLETRAPYSFPYHIIQKFGCWYSGQRENDIHWGVSTTTGNFDVWSLNHSFNNWHNIVFRYNGSNISVFINGQLSASEPASGIINTNTNKIYIGKYTLGGNYYFDGVLDDFRIYNRSLSDTEITELYHEGGWDN